MDLASTHVQIREGVEAMDKNSQKQCYVNRELSWLKFNERVLEEAEDSKVPLMERLNFISIFQSNLDEFFMVRVGSLHDRMLLSKEDGGSDNKTGMSCKEQLRAVIKRVKSLMKRKDAAYQQIMSELENYDICMARYCDLEKAEQNFIYEKFKQDVKPLLFPTILGKKQPIPFLKNKEIYGVAVLETKNKKRKIGIVPCSAQICNRTIKLPSVPGTFMLLEEVILHFFENIFPNYRVVEKSLIRIVRNADIDEISVYDEDLDYRDHMAEVVKMRRKLSPVRMEMSRKINEKIIKQLCEYLRLDKRSVFRSVAPLDFGFCSCMKDYLWEHKELFFEKKRPKYPHMLEKGPILPQILKKDVLLHYPYESMEPFLDMLKEASEDENVISIQMTLYRLAKNSKVIEALVNAAENGKEVNVLMELKARFDEENNIIWSRKLEEAGCNVTYGLDGLKVHSKLCLITRKQEDKIQYISQVGTGNYNEVTSRLYTDLSLITAKKEIGEQIAKVFRFLLLGKTVKEVEYLLVAPNCLQNRVLNMIQEEIRHAKNGEEAYIGVKVNSLTDKKIIDTLIEASQAGVKIEMIIRGICCVKPGIPEVTDNIQIKSIVGRLLEHSRIYMFGVGERRKIYISSADYMTRNTLRRVEVAVPIFDMDLRQKIEEIFAAMWSDNVKARVMKSDGTYTREAVADTEFCAQQFLLG